MTESHPLVAQLVAELTCDDANPEKNLDLEESTVRWLVVQLEALGDSPAVLESVLGQLEAFGEFLETQLESPCAASSVRFALNELPAYHALRSRAEGERSGEVGRAFQQFLADGSSTASEPLPQSDDPELAPVSAAALLRHHIR